MSQLNVCYHIAKSAQQQQAFVEAKVTQLRDASLREGGAREGSEASPIEIEEQHLQGMAGASPR